MRYRPGEKLAQVVATRYLPEKGEKLIVLNYISSKDFRRLS
jgi:hypothetical protein